jgi:tetratricopeptide (TPR) repeat protein
VPQDEDVPAEKEIPEAYLNRAKCYLLFGEKKRAFQDLQSYISYKPLDPEIHILAGRLLFSIGAAEDAIKAYSNCPNIDKNSTE